MQTERIKKYVESYIPRKRNEGQIAKSMKSCYWNMWIIDSDLKCTQEFLWKFDKYNPEKLWADYEY